MLAGLGSLLLFGALCVSAIGWLCHRRRVWVRVAGVFLAMVMTIYCLGVALILVAGSVAAQETPRVGGVLSTLAFAGIACATAATAGHGVVKNRVRA
jgi:hypothetical protein